MKDLGFILLSWSVSLGSLALLALATLRRAKSLAARVPDDQKPWL
ncbi:MAG: hypothetical protein ACO3D1_02435 [Ilumatobacteraceae bacterium]|jgi:hypothetical protein